MLNAAEKYEASLDSSDKLVDEKAKKNFESLPEDIKASINILRQEASGNLILGCIERELQLGKHDRLVLLDQWLDRNGESIASFKGLSSEEQEKAAGCMEKILNPYFQGDEKEIAKQELLDILG